MPGPKTASPRATARIAASVATLYLDTSALVKFYVKEEGRETVFEAVKGADRVATSTVAYAEARAAFARKVRLGDLQERGRRQAVSDLNEEWRGFVRIRSPTSWPIGPERWPNGTTCGASRRSTLPAPSDSERGSPTCAFWPSTTVSWKRRARCRCKRTGRMSVTGWTVEPSPTARPGGVPRADCE